jgi:hypothetical protein
MVPDAFFFPGVALTQALIPLGLKAVAEELEAEVTDLGGEWYSRTGRQPGVVWWSRQEGSVYLLDQKVPVRYRWVRDRLRHAEVPLQTYERLREPYVK